MSRVSTLVGMERSSAHGKRYDDLPFPAEELFVHGHDIRYAVLDFNHGLCMDRMHQLERRGGSQAAQGILYRMVQYLVYMQEPEDAAGNDIIPTGCAHTFALPSSRMINNTQKESQRLIITPSKPFPAAWKTT